MRAASLAALALAVKAGWLAGVDRAVAEAASAMRSPALDQAAKLITFFGSGPWTLLMVSLMAARWLRRGRWETLKVFLAVGGVGMLVQSALRFAVGQWRPDTVIAPAWTDLAGRYEASGFPSGHVFRAALLYGWWGAVLRRRRTPGSRWLAAGCGALTLLVGATRIVLGRHWLTDVLGAWWLAGGALAAARALSSSPPLKNAGISCMHVEDGSEAAHRSLALPRR